jgi:pyruvate/2-oxoglutarate dehydrogenase complex dihydrolipoamide acyltransferase (E2) component
MGIFSSIKDAIFGHHETTAAPASAAPTTATEPVSGAPAVAAAATPAAPPAAAPVDVAAIMDKLADEHGGDLNWRSSIVDLMKLLDLDSSLDHRKQLADELHFDGDTDDSSTMNIWLHRHVMTELAASGGKVPADLA